MMTWGSNVPMTRTPDAHFLAEVRYKGTKVVSSTVLISLSQQSLQMIGLV